MSIASNIVDTVGNTPLIKLNTVTAGLECEVFVKAEFFNPLFSVKDRIGKSMVEAAEKDGRLKPGGTIVEATSGNTGIALAFDEYDLRKLSAGISSDNIGSLKAYTRAGFEVEGMLKGQFLIGDTVQDRIEIGCFNPKYFPAAD